MAPTKKKPVKSAAKTKEKKTYRKRNESSASTSCENAKIPKLANVNGNDNRTEIKKQAKKSTQKKKVARPDAKRNNRKKCSNDNNVSKNFETPKKINVGETHSLPSSSSNAPTYLTPSSSYSIRTEENTPFSFNKVTKGDGNPDGNPVFSKSLLKYYFTVDSPTMDDLKNKRWNTSFIHETPKPNREIKIFTEEEDNDPKYFENMPNIVSNVPDVPGSLHTDVFISMPLDKSDKELKDSFKKITPLKGPNGKKKRKSTRISCYNGKPLPVESQSFDYSGLIFEDNSTDSKECN